MATEAEQVVDNTLPTRSNTSLRSAIPDQMEIIKPFNRLRNIHDMRTALVVASEGCLNLPDDLRTFNEGDPGVNVYYTSKLPLSNQSKCPPIDVVVLVCNVFNTDSLTTLKNSIPYIDVRYFESKCFLLAIADHQFSGIDTEDIEVFASSYMMPVHFVMRQKAEVKDKQPRLVIPDRLVSIYCPPVGCDVSSSQILAAMSNPLI